MVTPRCRRNVFDFFRQSACAVCRFVKKVGAEFTAFNTSRQRRRRQRRLGTTMSALVTPLAAAIAVAYDPMVVPVSDRVLSLVEDCPLGAMALLAGLLRQREGAPLGVLVQLPYRSALCNVSLAHLVCVYSNPHMKLLLPVPPWLQVPGAVNARRFMVALELHPWTFQVRLLFIICEIIFINI